MFRVLRRLTVACLSLAAGATLPSLANAAPMTLRYDFTAVVTATSYWHMCYELFDQQPFDECASYSDPTTYQGPALSTRGASSLTVRLGEEYDGTFDASWRHSILGLPELLGGGTALRFDPVGKGIALWGYNYSDVFEISITPGEYRGEGFGRLDWEQDGSGIDRAETRFRIFDVRVTELAAPQPGPAPDLAPVPLPAALPMLAGGLLGLGWLGRRRRARASA